jgi:hypothetical protein
MVALALLISLACASASVDSVARYGADQKLPRPPVFLVYDFAVSPSDVITDTLGPQYGTSSKASSQKETQARKVAASLSKQLVDKLNRRGIKARWADDPSVPPTDAIVLRGHFLTIEEGSRLKRMVIGFGVGASELRVHVQVYQASEWGLRRIVQAEASAQGSRAPGMAVPIGVGAVAGAAARSAVISGGMNIVQEVTGGLEADAGRIAEEIAKRAEAFYKRQGWL